MSHTYSMEQNPSWEANRFSTMIVKNPPYFMEPEGSLPRSHLPLSWTRSIHAHTSYFLKIHRRIILSPPTFAWLFQVVCLSSSGLPTKTLYTPLFAPHVLHTQPITLILGEKKIYYLINRLHVAESAGQGIRHIVWRSHVHFLIYERLFLVLPQLR
jgi:hypothetical protein